MKSDPVYQLDPNAVIVVFNARNRVPMVCPAPDKRRAVERIITYVRGDEDWVDLSSASEEELEEVFAEIRAYYEDADGEDVTVYIQVPGQTDLEPLSAEMLFDFD